MIPTSVMPSNFQEEIQNHPYHLFFHPHPHLPLPKLEHHQTVRKIGESKLYHGRNQEWETHGASKYSFKPSSFLQLHEFNDREVVEEIVTKSALSFNFPRNKLVSLSSEHFSSANSFPIFQFICPDIGPWSVVQWHWDKDTHNWSSSWRHS